MSGPDRPEPTDAERRQAAAVAGGFTTVPASPATRLAAALRAATEAVTGTDLTTPALEAAAGHAEAAVAALAGGSPRPPRAAIDAPYIASLLNRSPMVGLDNPLAAPTSFAVDTDRVTLNATATFGSAYEGPPGCVHGGVLAGFFDEMLGMTQTFVGTSGMTGTLTIRYRNPTPLHAEIRFEAWVVGVDGRKINLAGQASHGDTVTAEAAGVFIAVAGDRFVGLAGAAADRAAHRRGVAPPA